MLKVKLLEDIILPIEAKSSNRYEIASLKKFVNKSKEQLDIAYVLHPGELKVENDVVYLPLYMTMLL